VAEQFQSLHDQDSRRQRTPEDEGKYLNGSTPQVLLGWDPVLSLAFRSICRSSVGRIGRIEDGVLVGDRIEDGVLVDGNETGIGDMSLIGILRPWSWTNERSVVRLTLLAGSVPHRDSSWLRAEEEARANAEATVDGAVGRASRPITFPRRQWHHGP